MQDGIGQFPFEGTCPQPDYSVGFRRTAFSQEQLRKLNVQFQEKGYYTATEEIFFPFFTCEIKCGNQALDIADRQNAHSMTIAVRGVVELYRTIRRQEELHRMVLAFSISHDSRMVRIYAHYPEIQGDEVKYYRHLIKGFDILSEEGKERWTAYSFTRNMYGKFMPDHLERIKKGVNDLPDPAPESFRSTMSLDVEENPGSQDTMTAPPSQELSVFKNPTQRKADGTIPVKEFARLTETLGKQLKEAKQEREKLMELLEKQREEAKKEREKAEQEREKAEQEAKKEREKAEQERTELIKLLKQQMGNLPLWSRISHYDDSFYRDALEMINLAFAGCMDGMTIVAFFHTHNYGAWCKRQNGEVPVPEPEPFVEAIEIRGDLQACNRLVEEILRAEREATEKKKGAKRVRGGELAEKDKGAEKVRIRVQTRAGRDARKIDPIEKETRTKRVKAGEPDEHEKEAKKVRVTMATARKKKADDGRRSQAKTGDV
ncbi:MAG: hypothetical protein M1816_005059 [Peltula sp. TS41687]|nr:MAG: hypothetical protein M1816_005059 [Peltula sp. TS41687]